jgi:uncharacterized PurR-regulated membrane protein YhhQ (DUF165 family)
VAEDLLPILTRFHREIILPDIQRVVGEAVDSLIFYPVAFMGIWSHEQLVTVMATNYCIKVGWEAIATPITYKVVAWLKRVEHEDYFDRETDFNPFTLQT